MAKEHKVLEMHYGERQEHLLQGFAELILLHAGTDLGLRQTVAVVAESGGPSVSHVALHEKIRLSAPHLHALVGRLAQGDEATPER
ncbi:hypothetical protein WME98_27560 [Sorangium sp. So ce296]|uniref:hypothetical protein n=1 Tax=Sorangium sp. So ce296 TaxID=3133296 RepID=UPI003F62914F